MPDATDCEYTLDYYEAGGEWHWKVTASNNEVIVGTQGEWGGFVSLEYAERNFALVQRALLAL